MLEKHKTIDYIEFYKELLIQAKENITNEKIFQSVIVDWDNTARYKNRSKFFKNASPKKFEKFLNELLIIEKKKKNEFIFINAWNEWSEGAYLEPDATNGYKYLEVIKKIAINN